MKCNGRSGSFCTRVKHSRLPQTSTKDISNCILTAGSIDGNRQYGRNLCSRQTVYLLESTMLTNCLYNIFPLFGLRTDLFYLSYLINKLSSTMPEFTVFNPFSELDTSWNSNIRIEIQEVLYYAESRFWTVLNEISNAEFNIDRQIWTQKLLKRELVCTLVYIWHKF